MLKKKEQIKLILKELIEKTWHPDRHIDWCLDEDDKKFINNEN